MKIWTLVCQKGKSENIVHALNQLTSANLSKLFKIKAVLELSIVFNALLFAQGSSSIPAKDSLRIFFTSPLQGTLEGCQVYMT